MLGVKFDKVIIHIMKIFFFPFSIFFADGANWHIFIFVDLVFLHEMNSFKPRWNSIKITIAAIIIFHFETVWLPPRANDVWKRNDKQIQIGNKTHLCNKDKTQHLLPLLNIATPLTKNVEQFLADITKAIVNFFQQKHFLTIIFTCDWIRVIIDSTPGTSCILNVTHDDVSLNSRSTSNWLKN